jgi:hypothetical protein
LQKGPPTFIPEQPVCCLSWDKDARERNNSDACPDGKVVFCLLYIDYRVVVFESFGKQGNHADIPH